MKHSINLLMLTGAITCAMCLPGAQVQAMEQASTQETEEARRLARAQALYILHELDAFLPNFERAVENAVQGKAEATTVATNYQQLGPSQLPVELRVQQMFDGTIRSQNDFIDKMVECIDNLVPSDDSVATKIATNILDEHELTVTSFGRAYTEVECWKIKADGETPLLENNIKEGVTFSEEVRVPLLHIEANTAHILSLGKALEEMSRFMGQISEEMYYKIHELTYKVLTNLFEVQSVLK